MEILLALYLAVFIGMIMFSIFMGKTFIKALIFSVDKMMVFFISYYFIHNYFSVKVASGNAVYFWNISLSLIVVFIYAILFKLIYDRLGVFGKIINFVISYVGVVATYHLITSMFIQEKDFYYLQLLNNQDINKVVNYILMGIVAIFVWRKREESLEDNM